MPRPNNNNLLDYTRKNFVGLRKLTNRHVLSNMCHYGVKSTPNSKILCLVSLNIDTFCKSKGFMSAPKI